MTVPTAPTRNGLLARPIRTYWANYRGDDSEATPDLMLSGPTSRPNQGRGVSTVTSSAGVCKSRGGMRPQMSD